MKQVALEVVDEPEPSVPEALGHELGEHSLPHVEGLGFRPVAVLARDAAGEMVGGAHGLVNWNWLHLGLLWVSEPMRGAGLGSRLLGAFEAAGVERGCAHVHLDTFSFQARPFYERHGYEVFGTLDEYPVGHERFFMKKCLRAS